MKPIVFTSILIVTCLVRLQGQYTYPHMPIPHLHNAQVGTVCYNYAMARAFGMQWNVEPCPIKNIGGSQLGTVDQNYFDLLYPYDADTMEILDNDVLAFEETYPGSESFRFEIAGQYVR